MALSHTYLLEVGCEELPAGFLGRALDDWRRLLTDKLTALAIPYGQLCVEGTPRRLACWITELPDTLPDTVQVVKGPPLKIAYDANGNPAPALLGFLKKTGLTPQQLTQQTLGNETYVVAEQVIPGNSLKERLPQIVLETFRQLAGPRFMRWGDGQTTFSRPVQWLVSLWDDSPCPVQYEIGPDWLLPSGVVSQGHRILANPVACPIPHATAYETTLAEKGHALVSVEKRRAAIEAQLHQVAAAQGQATVVLDDELLDHVTNLVEAPAVIVGRFEEHFLTLPETVLITVMKAHQKYFALRQADGRLFPGFLCVTNAGPLANDLMRQGNERVLRARLADAAFFLQDDLKQPLEQRLEALKGVTFQKGLGTLYDKTQRLEHLCGWMAEQLQLPLADQIKAVRAARLSKTDLVTSMVFELTELQGEVGCEYARRQGEDPDVALALFEQYLPRFAGDELPTCTPGVLLSIADKVDTLVGVFSEPGAKLPTGSKDPLGLRRLVNGLIALLRKYSLSFSLQALMTEAFSQMSAFRPDQSVDYVGLLAEFVTQRLYSQLRDQEAIPHDRIQAVLEGTPDLLDRLVTLHHQQTVTPSLFDKLTQLTQSIESRLPELLRATECANRIERILGDAGADPSLERLWRGKRSQINPALLQAESEQALQQALLLVEDAMPEQVFRLSPFVETFFDKVLVNDPDEAIRANRRQVLTALHGLYLATLGRLSCLDTTALSQVIVPAESPLPV